RRDCPPTVCAGSGGNFAAALAPGLGWVAEATPFCGPDDTCGRGHPFCAECGAAVFGATACHTSAPRPTMSNSRMSCLTAAACGMRPPLLAAPQPPVLSLLPGTGGTSPAGGGPDDGLRGLGAAARL